MATLKNYILVVDDDEVVRKFLSRVLSNQGYAVTTASNGREAVAMAIQTTFSLALLDLEMPEMDGIEALQAIRKIYSEAELPVIMATIHDESDTVVKMLDLGANDFITKPFDIEVLLARVRTQLALKKLHDEKEV